MKKILIVLCLWQTLYATQEEDFEGREGFSFGLGSVILGGCEKEEIWDEKGENIVGHERSCGAFPLLDMSIGYGFTKQFGLSLDIKTLGIASLMGIKAKYYMHDTRDTSFVSITGGALDVGNVHTLPVIGSYNHIVYGYAYGHHEFGLGAGVPYGDKSVIFHLAYKYMF